MNEISIPHCRLCERSCASTNYATTCPRQTEAKHHAIDLVTKIAVIEAVEAGSRSKTDIAKYFNFLKSTVSSVLKNKAELHSTSTFEPGRQRSRC